MRCPVCKYERKFLRTETTEKITYYKSGNKKGLPKKIDLIEKEIFEGDEDFTEIFANPINNAYGEKNYFYVEKADNYNFHMVPTRLFACPKCNAVLLDKT